MTYRALKYVIQGLLTGDNVIPKEDDVVKALLGMAYNHVANKCTVLNLLTLDEGLDIHRLSAGTYMIRKPNLPEKDEDILDIDEDLCYVVASLIASYISKEKVAIHDNRANVGIRDYNAKVDEIIERIKLTEEGRYEH